MSSVQPRQPPGRPGAGQYASMHHGEPAVTLARFETPAGRAAYVRGLEEAAVELADTTQRALMVDRALRVRALAPNVAVFVLDGESGTIRCTAGWDTDGREVGPVARRRVGEAFAGFAGSDFDLLLYQEIDVEESAGWRPGRAA